ncbi:MAG: SDR family oxidoreductase [Opitutales bacterium]|nr:SDR family oxidoreductase [Opitutales bacterium]
MNILLTGAGRGLGLEICKALLSQNHKVYAVCRNLSAELEKLAAARQGSLFFKSADLSDPEGACKKIFCADFISNKIPLGGFVSNAAAAYDDLVSNLNLARLEGMYKVNVFSPMMLARAAIRNMVFNGIGGSIVHISSVSAHTGYKGLAMYASTKGAIEAFSKNVAREWGGRGIRSNCVVCGFMDTDMSASLSAEARGKIYARTALKRPVSLKSAAEAVSFLLSEKAESITGQGVFVDSGTF